MSKVAVVVMSVLAVLVAAAPASAASMGDAPLRSPVQALHGDAVGAYGKLPLAFEPNRGQFARRALFAARGPGYSIALTRRGAVLGLERPGRRTAAVEIGFAGASRNPRVFGSNVLAGTVNYLRGQDRSEWHRNVPTFRRVGYRGVWRGIDAVFYGRDGQLEYDFEVAPGADPGRIALSFAGARSVRVDRAGAVVLGLPGGTVRQLAPVSFQIVDGERRAVRSSYVLRGKRVGVKLGAYDRSRRLVIDPVVLAYSTFLGGAGVESGQGIAVDGTGSAYIAGRTTSTDFPTTAGAPQSASGGSGDAFVSKVTPDGSGLVYSTYLGGTGEDNANAIAIDPDGAAYITGITQFGTFPTTAGSAQVARQSDVDAFVAKLTPDGSALAYSTFLGGTGLEVGNGIAVDGLGAAYVAGYTTSTDFPSTGGADTSHNGGNDAFVTKVAPGGASFAYSTYLGGAGSDEARGVAVDAAGAAYVGGEAASTNFPTTPGAADTTRGASFDDGFVTKVAPAGSTLAYSTYLGGNVEDGVYAIAIDGTGAAYVIGYTGSTDFPTTAGVAQSALASSYDNFVSKLVPAGSGLAWSTYLGGAAGDDIGFGIAVDGDGAPWVGGYTQSANYPVTADAVQTTKAAAREATATHVAADGTAFTYSTFLGGIGNDEVTAVAVDPQGAAYLGGVTSSEAFPTTPGVLDTTLGGNNDAFVAKLAEDDTTPPAPPSGLSTVPGSPGETTQPLVKGTAEAGSTVRVYTSAACSGAPVATGSAADFGSPGLQVTVAVASTTTFFATATDAFGNVSACSTDSATYTQRSPVVAEDKPAPVAAAPSPVPPAAAPVARPVVVPAAPIVLQTVRRCAGRRTFTIRLPREMRRATVSFGRKRVTAVRSGGRLRARVDLRGLPRRRAVVRVVGRTSSGRTVLQTRVYRPCTAKRDSGRTRW